MDTKHQDILRKNRSEIVQEIHDIESVAYDLEQNGIITHHMLEEILAQNTPTAKKREVLTILPRRGPDAFNAFYDILVVLKEGSAADILKPELAVERRNKERINYAAGQRPQQPSGVTSPTDDDDDDDNLPEKWPDEKLISSDFTVMSCESSGPMYTIFQRACEDSGQAYKHRSNPRGLALVINNENFEAARRNGCELEDRLGTGVDQFTLDRLLEQLHYKVVVCEDLTAEKIQKQVTDFSKKDHTLFDSFILIILSHGESQSIYGVDGKLINKDEIVRPFNGINCPSLSGKPKLFFFQACQGIKVDPGAPIASDEQTIGGTSDEPDNVELSLRQMKISKKVAMNASKGGGENVADVKSEPSIPSEGDVFIASATIPDYLSWRNTKKGTWFIQAIIYIFRKFAHKEDLFTLMTKVNRLVSRGRTETGSMQVSTFETRLLKTFYFFPGLYTSSPGSHLSLSNVQCTS